MVAVRFGLALLLSIAALNAAELSVESGEIPQLALHGAHPGARLQVLDDVQLTGSMVADRSGDARLPIRRLSSGPHAIRALEWGTGKIVAGPVHFTVPARPANSFTAGVSYATGLAPAVMASADLDGDGSAGLVFCSTAVAGRSSVIWMRNTGGTLGAPVKLASISEGAAVAVQDFNGDGLNDLAIAVPDGRVGILLNRGGGQFSSIKYFPAGSSPSAMVSADFNGDGIPDLAIANPDENQVSLLLGNGDGTFRPAIAVPAAYSPRALVAADFNGDGLADLATANFASNDVSILLGDGKGGFHHAGNVPAGNGPVSLVAADFNEDGAPDLAVLNQLDGSVVVLMNESDGMHAVASIPDAASLAAGDADGDGHQDLVIRSGREILVRTGRGDGTFGEGYRVASGLALQLAIADFNADGRLDVAAIDSAGTLTVLSGQATLATAAVPPVAIPEIHIDSPASGETVSGTVSIEGWATGNTASTGLVRVRVDGVEVGIAAYGVPRKGDLGFRYQLNTTLLSPGTHTVTVVGADAGNTHSIALKVTAFAPPPVYIDSLAPDATISGMVTVSGWAVDRTAIGRVQVKVDGTVVGTATYGTPVRLHVCASYPLHPRCPDVGFTYPLNASALSAGAHLLTVTAIDRDESREIGSHSLAVNVQTTPSATSLVSSLNTVTYFQKVTLTATISPSSATGIVTFEDSGILLGIQPLVNGQAVLTTSLPGTGTRSLRAYYSGNPIYAASTSLLTQMVTALPSSVPQSAVSYPAGTVPYAVAVGDFDGDGRADLAVANQSSGDVSVLLGNGDGTFQPPVNYDTDNYSMFVAVIDVNGDGKADLVVSNAGSPLPSLSDGTVSVLLGNGDGTFQAAVNYVVGNGSGPIVTGDFNGDGKIDIAISAGSNISVLLGNGNGTFQPGIFSFSGTISSLAIGDFNGDGNADLAASSVNAAGVYVVSVLFGNGNGTFQPPVNYVPGASSGPLAVGDFNGDGKADIAAGHFADNNVNILLGNGDGTFRSAGHYFAGSQPTAVAVGDFNGDGNADLAFASYIGNSVSILLGNGDGSFGSAVNLSGPDAPTSVVVGDFNGDGRADLAVANNLTDPTTGINYPGTVGVLLGVPVVPPSVYIDSLSAGAAVSGTVTVSGWALDNTTSIGTAIGSVQVKVDGSVVGTATYGTSRQDVCAAFPGRPGCPNVGFTYQLNASSLGSGNHTLTVLATDTDPGVPDSGSFSVPIKVIGLPPPSVHIDSPAAGATVSGLVTISGWAIDSVTTVGTSIGSVAVQVDGTAVGFATYGAARSDVCAAFPGRPGCPNVGFTYQLNATALTAGPHIITVVATDTDTVPDTGSYAVSVNVNPVPAPAVHVDSPAAGAVISGTVTVSGWAIDDTVAIGSVQVQVDGTPFGAANYGSSRIDVCNAYPGRPGCPNVGFNYPLDTSSLSPGTHTLTVIATGTDGNPGSYSLTVKK